jgi:hypothetical protein
MILSGRGQNGFDPGQWKSIQCINLAYQKESVTEVKIRAGFSRENTPADALQVFYQHIFSL